LREIPLQSNLKLPRINYILKKFINVA